MSTDIELAQRPSAELIGGGFAVLPIGVGIYLLTRGGESSSLPIAGLVVAAAGWVLLGMGLARVGAKVDDLYRSRVTRFRTGG